MKRRVSSCLPKGPLALCLLPATWSVNDGACRSTGSVTSISSSCGPIATYVQGERRPIGLSYGSIATHLQYLTRDDESASSTTRQPRGERCNHYFALTENLNREGDGRDGSALRGAVSKLNTKKPWIVLSECNWSHWRNIMIDLDCPLSSHVAVSAKYSGTHSFLMTSNELAWRKDAIVLEPLFETLLSGLSPAAPCPFCNMSEYNQSDLSYD